MKVVVDNKIPFIRDVLDTLGVEATYMPGAAIDREAVADAEALIVRTRTCCNAALLDGSRIRFIATATIGYDHIDTAYVPHMAYAGPMLQGAMQPRYANT